MACFQRYTGIIFLVINSKFNKYSYLVDKWGVSKNKSTELLRGNEERHGGQILGTCIVLEIAEEKD